MNGSGTGLMKDSAAIHNDGAACADSSYSREIPKSISVTFPLVRRERYASGAMSPRAGGRSCGAPPSAFADVLRNGCDASPASSGFRPFRRRAEAWGVGTAKLQNI